MEKMAEWRVRSNETRARAYGSTWHVHCCPAPPSPSRHCAVRAVPRGLYHTWRSVARFCLYRTASWARTSWCRRSTGSGTGSTLYSTSLACGTGAGRGARHAVCNRRGQQETTRLPMAAAAGARGRKSAAHAATIRPGGGGKHRRGRAQRSCRKTGVRARVGACWLFPGACAAATQQRQEQQQEHSPPCTCAHAQRAAFRLARLESAHVVARASPGQAKPARPLACAFGMICMCSWCASPSAAASSPCSACHPLTSTA